MVQEKYGKQFLKQIKMVLFYTNLIKMEKNVYKYTDQKEKNKKSMGKDHKTAEK